MFAAKLASHLQRFPRVALRTRLHRTRILMKPRPSCVNSGLAEGRCLESPVGGWVEGYCLQSSWWPVQGHPGYLHCLTHFICKGTDGHKAKPVIITLLIALSRDSYNLHLSYLAHLSIYWDFLGKARTWGLLGAILSKHHLQIISQVRWLPSFSFAKPFLFLHWKETQHNCCNFFHVNYKYLESLSRE